MGPDGPVLRFRLHPSDRGPYKTVREAFADCVDCARLGGESAIGRAAIFLAAMPLEMALRTAPWTRLSFLAALVALTLGALVTVRSTLSLERRFASETARVASMTDRYATRQDLSASQADFESQRTALLQRLETLETRSAAGAQVVAHASPAVVFLQGVYGFVDRDTRRPLRYLSNGESSALPGHRTRTLGFEGRGPILETRFTGTAFVATDEGHLLTNRQLATPWAFESSARPFLADGLVPVMRRFVAYLPGVEDAVPVRVVATSDEADAAILECASEVCDVPPIPMSPRPPRPGEEVIILGYPTGVWALIARGDPDLRALADRPGGFWEVTRRLAARRQINPLATRGIVGQASEGAIVYDAETAPGGSGSPVLDLEGRVVALNTAVLSGFDGANMGVPAAWLRPLLEKVTDKEREDRARPWPPNLSPSK